VIVDVTGEVWFWKGPAPWFFVTVPEAESEEIKAVESIVTYGWGMIPVNARIGDTEWYTALWPKDGLYILPIKAFVRKAEKVEEGRIVTARLEVIGGR
jgi:hypothetical protein